MQLPEHILTLLHTLNEAGYQAYVVGGCVRDAVLGRPCHDYDVCTDAKPEVVRSLFAHTVPTGIRHGTITVLTPEPVEVTTFRTETQYKDHRHPDTVAFVTDVKEDLARRDFTINAMAYHPDTGIVDPFGGQEDCQKGIVRCVGDPVKRFDEDALRMLRAHRFCARFHFAMDPATKAAINRKQDTIRYVSIERIRQELIGILEADPYEIEKMLPLFDPWIPELQLCKDCLQHTPWHDCDVLHHSLRAIKCLKPFDETMALALLFHDLGKPLCKTTRNGKDHFYGHPKISADIARRLCRTLKLSNNQKENIVSWVLYHDECLPETLDTLYTFMVERKKDEEWMEKYFAIRICDMKAHSLLGRQSIASIEQFIDFYRQNLYRPVSGSQLAISGKDVIEETPFRGKQIAAVLQACLKAVFYDPESNTRERLLDLIGKEDLIC